MNSMDPVPESAENRVRERGAVSRFDCLLIKKKMPEKILGFEEVVLGVVYRTCQLTKKLKKVL